MYTQLKGKILVLFQFLLFGLIIYTGRKINWTIWQAGLVVAGVFIAIWAILLMRKSKLRINPVPDPSATLVSSGIYKWIRSHVSFPDPDCCWIYRYSRHLLQTNHFPPADCSTRYEITF